MFVLSSVDYKGFLIGLVSNTVSNFGAKHHLWAVHVIVHDILKGWLESFLVNKIKIDLVITSNLDSNISFNIINEASWVDLLVQFPFTSFSDLIGFNSEEENLTWASANESIVVNEVHLTEISISHPVIDIIGIIVGWNDVWKALSIERIYFVELIVIEWLVREVLFGAIHDLFTRTIALHRFSFDVVDKVIVGQSEVMEQIDEDSVVSNEWAGNVRVRKSLDGHGPVVDAQQLVDV